MKHNTPAGYLASMDLAGLFAHNRALFGAARMDSTATVEPDTQTRDESTMSFTERIDARRTEMEAITTRAEGAEGGELGEEDATRFDALDAEVRTIQAERERHEATSAREARVRELNAAHAERVRAAGGRTPTTVGSEPQVYRDDAQSPSYFRDLFQATVKGRRDAFDRLERNDRMLAGDQTRALSTGAGAGGEFAPPAWMIDQYIALNRAGRPLVNAMPKMDLPGGVSSVNIPKIGTGTVVAQQNVQNTQVQNTDLTTTFITLNILTEAGGQVVAQQLIDQAGFNLDQVIWPDLTADYFQRTDGLVVNSVQTNALGLLGIALATSHQVAYTNATPSAAGLYKAVMQAAGTVNQDRHQPATHVIMTPMRWAWLCAQVDSSNRPLVLPSGSGVFNAMGSGTVNSAAEGVVGQWGNLQVMVDAQLPTNLGAGTNQDPVIVTRIADSLYGEGNLKAEVFQQTFANQLSVYFRLYNYVAFTWMRQPASTAVITGTGLVTPAFS